MAAPDSAAELLPISWQITVAIATLATTLAGVVWKFFKALNASEPHAEQRVVLEQAELADMTPVREFVRDFRPALERLSRIEGMSIAMKDQLKDVWDKLDRMERAADVAKQVREELARRQDRIEREHDRRRHRDDRDD